MWSRVDLVWADVSEERIAYIFREEKSASEEPAWPGGCRLSMSGLPIGEHYVGFEVFATVTMKNAVFWDVEPCRSCVNRRFVGTYLLHLQGRKIRERGTSICSHLLTLVPRSRIFLPWKWRPIYICILFYLTVLLLIFASNVDTPIVTAHEYYPNAINWSANHT
jgi:hypothetical protein